MQKYCMECMHGYFHHVIFPLLSFQTIWPVLNLPEHGYGCCETLKRKSCSI